MSSIHYFQRYSQRENVVTNNTLLLFGRLYDYSSQRFQAFINELLGITVEVGISMEQQKKVSGGSIPDGYLAQESFKIVVETKLHEFFDLAQLTSHLSAFENEKTQILLSLSPSEPEEKIKSEIKTAIDDYNRKENKKIIGVSTTFQKIIKVFKDSLLQQDFDMQNLIEDYESFCIDSAILPIDEYRMRVITSSWSYPENFEFNIYYDQVQRGFQKHKYFGLYYDKSVRGIGRIENIVVANLNDKGELEIKNSEQGVTDSQRQNIIKIMNRAEENNGWEIYTDHRFFIVDKFYETDFPKTSKFPIQRTKYFDLREILSVDKLPNTKEIADMLKTKSWE